VKRGYRGEALVRDVATVKASRVVGSGSALIEGLVHRTVAVELSLYFPGSFLEVPCPYCVHTESEEETAEVTRPRPVTCFDCLTEMTRRG